MVEFDVLSFSDRRQTAHKNIMIWKGYICKYIYFQQKYLKYVRTCTGLQRSRFLCSSQNWCENEYFVYSCTQCPY